MAEEELTEKQKLGLAKNFVRCSPPGQSGNVLEGETHAPRRRTRSERL